MTIRERAIRALEAWVRSWPRDTGLLSHELKMDEEEILHDPKLINAIVAEFGWRPIETLPENDRLVLAKTDDGRRMIWPAVMLRGNLKRIAARREPDHLQFPAVAWAEIPE